MSGLLGHREEFGSHSKRNVEPLEGLSQVIKFLVHHVKEFGLCSENNMDLLKI